VLRTLEQPSLSEATQVQLESWVVVVYDNDENTAEEVISILLIATHCSMEEAEIETWEVHHLGKSVVHHGEKDECDTVAQVIRQIGIRVEVINESE
jgi:ATP-dependent Clp protease adaptor protein ClpS